MVGERLIYFISAAYWFLTWRQLSTKACWVSPCFTLYCMIVPIHYLTWSPHSIPTLILWEPLLTLLKLGMVAELFLLSTRWICPTERRWLLVALVLVGLIGAVVMVGYYEGNKLSDTYKSFRLQLHVAFALASGLSTLLISCRLPKPIFDHGMILALFFSVHVASNLLPLTWWGANLFFWLGSLLCITFWFIFGLPTYVQPKLPA